MKIRALIPAIIAISMLLGAPFGVGPMHDSDPGGRLMCYCCSGAGTHCTMISCSGCGGAHAGVVDDRWSPEMTLESIPTISPLPAVYGEGETSQKPKMTYLEVRDKPPEQV